MIEFTAEIHCRVPGENLSYRFYVDDDLITERTWAWDNSVYFINEHVLVNLEEGPHRVYITVPGSLSINRFEVGKITLDGSEAQHQNGVFEYVK